VQPGPRTAMKNMRVMEPISAEKRFHPHKPPPRMGTDMVPGEFMRVRG